ncbi:hypothetical protein G8764_09035 [Pseudomaricurvus alcaniphilus]|uniref:hypothetical protein n=1 Tax=Pseudomaricurvus alcaniphilus TaxID=1166482 RepID=UPI00140ADC13|nr:hypothetical protein [Pseudomaricurvus alcaniphilus]NHN37433.1 hypothetical protein [Pseudomaricurvus alcaniphilus]
MIGLFVITVTLLYPIALVYFLWSAVKSKGEKRLGMLMLFFALILIPFGDVPFNLYRFNKLCEKEAGIFVYHKVGLPPEYFVKEGEPIRKIIYRENGGSGSREVKAKGNEIDIEKLKARYQIEDHSKKDIVSRGYVSSYTTTVMDGEKLLGKAVTLYGGGGWFFRKFTPGGGGKSCPEKIRRPGYVDMHKKVLYEIFYKIT